MKIVIDINEDRYRQIKDMPNAFGSDICKAIRNGTPLADITDEQISEAFQIAIANYWEEKSKYLTPPPTPTESRRGVFMASPTEVIKVGEPLPNSDAINKALEKGEIYKRGFEDAKKIYEQPQGEWKEHKLRNDIVVEYAFKCSNCKKDSGLPYRTDFCPNCGADMRKGGEEE